jgi:cbb3-type cytochrome oxidase subunit 3
MEEEWKENTKIGFTFSMLFFIPMLVLLFLIPTLYHIYWKEYKRNKD